MAVYEIKEFSGGISSFSDRGIRGSFKFASNIDIRKSIDSLSCGQALVDEGLTGETYSGSPSKSPSASASPSASPTPSESKSASQSPSRSLSPSASASRSPSPSLAQTTIFRDLIHFFVKCTDGNTYGFGNTGHIYRRLQGAFWAEIYKDPDGEIKGAEEKPSSGGATYLEWATDTTVKRKLIPGDSGWGDVQTISSSLNSETWHTMKQVGGANMICNGSMIALSGYDDSFTEEALDLIPGNIATAIVERNGRAVIGTVKAWDPTKGVNAMIDAEVPLSQIGDDGELFFANFTDSIPVKRFPGGGRVNPGGVANEVDQVSIFDWEQTADSWIDKQSLGNMSLWGVFDADSGKNGIYTYGRKNKEQPFTMNLEYALDVDEIGAVINVEGVTLASYRDGNTFGVKAVDPLNKGTGIYEGLEFRSPSYYTSKSGQTKRPDSITKYVYIEMFMDPLPERTSVEFHYKMNKTGAWVQAFTADGQAIFNTVNGKKAVFRIGAEGEVYEPRIVMNPYGNTTPDIYRVRTYFE